MRAIHAKRQRSVCRIRVKSRRPKCYIGVCVCLCEHTYARIHRLIPAKPGGFTNTIVWNIRALWQEVALAPVINELKFGVAMLPLSWALSLSLFLTFSFSFSYLGVLVSVRFPTPISRVPHYREFPFWPPRKPTVTPFTPSHPGKLYRCFLVELLQYLLLFFIIVLLMSFINVPTDL